ncbi:unnamed protein product [Trichogramma brassicae]|uniref:Uncharacterized protein n=1 Tax=Trichogramma brassicae TaxID=86971 RepID=A0A6H5J4C2_9HYME|nr:unnamed protein product [Trichogramma brassicae]
MDRRPLWPGPDPGRRQLRKDHVLPPYVEFSRIRRAPVGSARSENRREQLGQVRAGRQAARQGLRTLVGLDDRSQRRHVLQHGHEGLGLVLGHEKGVHTPESGRRGRQQHLARLSQRHTNGPRGGSESLGAVQPTAHVSVRLLEQERS